MLDLNSDKIKIHFSKYAIFQMKLAVIELKFDVQTFFDADLHFYWSVGVGFDAYVGHDEFLLFGNPIVISIDDYVDIIPQIDNYAIICFKLFFNPVELKIVGHVVGQSTWRLQIPHDLEKSRILILIIEVLDHTN